MEPNTITTQDTSTPQAEPVTPVSQPPQTDPPAVDTPRTSEDKINGRITRESRKQLEALLKEAGIMPDDDPKMQLKAYKKWQDAQKTELEKAIGDTKTLTNERDAALTKLQNMERCMAAIAKGVPAEKAERYVKLSETYLGEDADYDKALDAALKDFPITLPEPEPSIPLRAGTYIGGEGEAKMDMNTFLRTTR